MSCDSVIKVNGLGKDFRIYERPSYRFFQLLFGWFIKLAYPNQPSIFFKKYEALSDVSFEVKKGESVGIIGRNGAGKSTLLQIIAGILQPTDGSVSISGRVVALLELGSGFNPEFTGIDNARLNLSILGLRSDEIDSLMPEVIEFADIGDFINLPVKTYSSGMFARLSFAVAIHASPDILIVDEILAVGDVLFQRKCFGRLYSLMDSGVSVLLVSHDAYQVRTICEKAVLLERGRQVVFDNSERVMDKYLEIIAESTDHQSNDDKGLTDPLDEISGGLAKPADGHEIARHFMFSIHNVVLRDMSGRESTHVKSKSDISISFEYRCAGFYDSRISFVVNLYRSDDSYIFGTTTEMVGLDGFSPGSHGRVTVKIPAIPVVAGDYKFRVAINDERGLQIFTEAVPVCPICVTDDFAAVGFVDIEHYWHHEVLVEFSETK